MGVLAFKNSSIDNFAGHGDQAEEFEQHPRDSNYYEESDIDENENADDDDDTPLIFEKLCIDFKLKKAGSRSRIDESHDELSKRFDKGFKKMQRYIDASINNVVIMFNKIFFRSVFFSHQQRPKTLI